jgi:hypothetical protein
MEGFGSVQIITDPDPEGPKTYRSYGYGSGTLVGTGRKMKGALEEAGSGNKTEGG